MRVLKLIPAFCLSTLLALDPASPDLAQKINRISEQNAYNGWQGRSGSASIDSGFVTRASYLLWKAREEGLEYAQSAEIDISTLIVADVMLLEPDFKWSSGFQTGIGYIFSGRQQWETSLDWTHYNTKAKDSRSLEVSNLTEHNLRPTWLPLLLGTINPEASARWNLNFNTLDLTIGRNFFSGKWISFHPKASIRGAWINQKYLAKYAGYQGPGGTPFPLDLETYFQAKWTFRALGLRLGSDAEWHLNQNFSIVGSLYGSLLQGKFKVKETFFGGFVPLPPTVIVEEIYVHNKYYRMRPVLEAELGARWGMLFMKEKRVSVSALYSMNYWFNQNELLNQFIVIDANFNSYVTNLPAMGNLHMQGLRTQLEFDF